MNILPYSLNFPLSLTFILLHAKIRRGGHTVGITSTVVAGCYYCCYCSAVFLFVHLPSCRRSFRAGLFIYSLFCCYYYIISHYITAYLSLRSAVPGQRPEYIFASDSVRLHLPACLAQLRLIADLDSVSFPVSFPVGLLSVSVKESLKKEIKARVAGTG